MYVDKFNEMEQFLREKQTQQWQLTRAKGKLTRNSETDVIKKIKNSDVRLKDIRKLNNTSIFGLTKEAV